MVGIGLTLMLFGLVYYVTGPRYKGVVADKWLDLASSGMLARPMTGLANVAPGTEQAAAIEEPVEAFRQMGRRGVSCLIAAYVDQKPAWKGLYERLALRLRGVVRLPVRPSPNAWRRSGAAYRLILRIGPSAIPEVVRWTKTADAATRVQLLGLLGEFGPGHPQSQDCLFQMLTDPSPRVIFAALEGLWMTEPEPTSAIATIVPFLNHANARVREEATYALGMLAPVPASRLQPLVEALSDRDGTVRANAARAIGLSGALSEEVFSALARLLDDSNAVTRFRAGEALVRLHGSDALGREPLLMGVIREAERSSNGYFCLIGFNSRTALDPKGMTDPATVGLFRRLLADPRAYFRSDALAGLMFRLERNPTGMPTEIETLVLAAERDYNGLVRFLARSILEGRPGG